MRRVNLGAVCRIVGAEAVSRSEEPFEFLPWSEETEVASIKGMDIGLMPSARYPLDTWQMRLQAYPVYGVRVASCRIASRRQL